MKKILLTGSAGFIGYHLSKSLVNDFEIIGVDNINDYYDVKLKEYRLNDLKQYSNFNFYKTDIADYKELESIFLEHEPDIVVNLAAQAGVRYSIDNPQAYINSNIIGFFNVLELCRHYPVEHLVYASSSSVYGNNEKVPYSEKDNVDNPVSLYAASKKSNELMAHSYSKLYGIPSTGLRFFTVYGPAGRPDMAYFKFTEKIRKGESIQIYNNGDLKRDFTYIDDIVEGLKKVINKVPEKNSEGVQYKIYNIGNNKPEDLLNFVNILEALMIKYHIVSDSIKKEFLPMQQGDVYQTFADMSEMQKDFDFKAKTSLKEGLEKYIQWYVEYNKIV